MGDGYCCRGISNTVPQALHRPFGAAPLASRTVPQWGQETETPAVAITPPRGGPRDRPTPSAAHCPPHVWPESRKPWVDLRNRMKDPHPCPLPEYRERGRGATTGRR